MTKLKNNGKEKIRPSSIDTTSIVAETTTPTWPHLNVLNQIMTPVQILNDNSLQQELDFFTRTQFKFNETNGSAAATAPITAAASTVTTPIVTNSSSSSYFDSLNIPSDQNHQEYNTNQYSNDHNYASLLFHQQQQQQQQRSQPNTSSDGSLLLTHEPRNFTQNAQQQHQHQHQHQQQQRTLQSLYSNNSTPANSAPTSPVINFDNHHHQQNYFEAHDNNYNDHSDRFASMFLTSSASSSNNNNETNNKNKGKKNAQKFRFKQDTQPLDSQILSKHNMEQDKRSGIKRSKTKQKAPATKVPKKKPTKKSESDDEGNDDEDDDDEEEGDEQDEDEPVIGDGALSYSSMGSNGSQPLTKDDKRRRNTAASARFRIKKKMREQALQNTACEMTDKAQRMEQRVHELEREIKWLKALVVEKSEVRIEQLVRERPPDSTAFPNKNNNVNFPSSSAPSSSSTSRNKNYMMMMSNKEDGEDDDEDDDDELGGGRDQDDYQYNHQSKNRRRY